MIDRDLFKMLRNRWVLLAIFVLLLPVANEGQQQLGEAGLLPLPSAIAWMVTGGIGLYLGLGYPEEE